MKLKSNQPSARNRWLVFMICWLVGVFAGMDANLFSVMMQQAIADVAGNPSQTEAVKWGSTLLSSFLLGWMLGGILMGVASDYLGRVKTLALSVILYSCFTGLAAQTESMGAFGMYRFAAGMGVGGSMLGISIFIAESWTTSSRALALAALVTSYQVGVLFSGVISHILPDWRMAFAAGSIPMVLAFAVLKLFHEPAAWKNMKTTSPEHEEKSGRNHLLMGGMIFGSLLIGYWASLSWIPSWIQNLLGDSALGHEKSTATVIHGLCAIAGCLAAGPLADAFGRRPIILFSFAGALIDSLWMFQGHHEFSNLLYAYHGLLGFFIGMAQAVMYIYLPELFSTKIRATCVGICLNGGRLVTAIAILFMGVIVSWFQGYSEALSLFSMVYLIGIGFTLFAPETKMRVFNKT